MKKKKWDKDRVLALRKKLNLTQWELAKRLGYKSYWAVYEWEAGRRIPNKRATIILDFLESQNGA